MNNTIAKTILAQLGGNRFVVMTGARNLVAGENYLSFRLPGKNFAKNGINVVTITLNPSDTYDMKFQRLYGTTIKDINEFNDVYNDQLQEIFTNTTGLATHL